MALPVKPPLKRSFARNRYAWVPAIDDIEAPELDEITALAAFNLSCVVFGDQEQPTSTTEKTELPRLNCETETNEVNGSTKNSVPDFMVSFDPQAAAGADGKLAWEAMDDLADGFLVRMQDADPNAEFLEDDFIDIWPAQLTVKVPTQKTNDAAGVYAFTVGVSVTGSPKYQSQIVDTP